MVLICAAPSYQISGEELRNTIAPQITMLADDIESLGG